MTTMTDITAPLRRETDRGAVSGRLVDISDARVDVVTPANRLWIDDESRWGLELPGDAAIVRDSGVFSALNGSATRTAVAGLAERCRIPLAYVDRLTPDYRPLLATNFNRLLRDDDGAVYARWLNVGDEWLLRSVSGGRYRVIDNLDMLVAVADGVRAADLNLDDAEVEADWTMDRFRLRVAIPGVSRLLPTMENYRWPFSTDHNRAVHDRWVIGDGAPPMLWAGFEATNSETGQGAAAITPRVVFQVCRNGAVRKVDALRTVHAGAALDEGIVEWSSETRRQQLELVTSQITDAVRSFVSHAYLERIVDEMDEAARTRVDSSAIAVGETTLAFGFTEAEHNRVLDAFVRGGLPTVLGVANAVTAAAQGAESGDRQAEMEQTFFQIVGQPNRFAGTVG